MFILGLIMSVAVQAADDRPVFTRFQISREKEEHKVSVSAALRNPAAQDLVDLWVSIIYFDGERELRTSKPQRLSKLAARETATLTLDAKQVEKFSRYEVGVETDQCKLVYAGTPGDDHPKFQRMDRPLERPGLAGPTVELRGLKWFDRDPLDARAGGVGDVPFLRFAVRRKGQVLHPTGKLQIMLFDYKKPLRFLNISLEDACYQRDAGELTGKTALPETTAYDPITGEVWVGLTRMEHSRVALRLDIAMSLENLGSWQWTGLEKAARSDPREPDRK